MNRRLVQETLPIIAGDLHCAQLNAPIDIQTSDAGIPAIRAETDTALFFAWGYTQARDRLWQMDFLRRTATGRLAELRGNAYVDADLFFLELDLSGIAQAEFKRLSPLMQQLLLSFSQGVNCYIKKSTDHLPIQFSIQNYRPVEWKPIDCLTIWYLYRWMNASMVRDLIEMLLQKKLQPDYLNVLDLKTEFDISPATFNDLLRIIPKVVRIQYRITKLLGIPNVHFNDDLNNDIPIITDSTYTSLAFAPVSALTIPSIWYLQQLMCPGYQVWGCSIPGIPLIFSGTNGQIAWAIHPAERQDTWIHIRNLREDNENEQYHQSVLLHKKLVGMPVAPKDTLWKEVWELAPHILLGTIPDSDPSWMLCCDWTGLNSGSSWESFTNLWQNASVDSVRKHFQDHCLSANRIFCADTAGNGSVFEIGVEFVPASLRKNQRRITDGVNYQKESIFREIPVDSKTTGYVNIQNRQDIFQRKKVLPVLYNPDPSPFASQVMPRLKRFLEDLMQNSQLKNDIYFLLNWPYEENPYGLGATIFNLLIEHLIENIFKDEMGNQMFHLFRMIPDMVACSLIEVLHDSNSVWLDDVNTPDIRESLEHLVKKSALQVHRDLFVWYEGLLAEMHWKKASRHTIRHALGYQGPKSYILNTPPVFYRDGGFPLNSFPVMNRPDQMICGHALHLIYRLDQQIQIYWQLLPGQSGNPLSANYKNQTKSWLNREYHRTTLGESTHRSVLRLIPVEQ